jgi:hypothetical protein
MWEVVLCGREGKGEWMEREGKRNGNEKSCEGNAEKRKRREDGSASGSSNIFETN